MKGASIDDKVRFPYRFMYMKPVTHIVINYRNRNVRRHSIVYLVMLVFVIIFSPAGLVSGDTSFDALENANDIVLVNALFAPLDALGLNNSYWKQHKVAARAFLFFVLQVLTLILITTDGLMMQGLSQRQADSNMKVHITQHRTCYI